jgi:hypothetical protein
MPHYSEMDFLFSDTNRNVGVTQYIDNSSRDNTQYLFDRGKQYITSSGATYETTSYVVYKRKNKNEKGTNFIKNYLSDNVYKNEKTGNYQNPYVKLINDFSDQNVSEGLVLKAADLAYLRELGVYPINRMAILRRFPEGSFLPEDLNEMTISPVSVVIGWIKPDQNFGTIGFNESWSKTNNRFDQMIAKILKERLNIDIEGIVPVPAFAQGLLFEFFKRIGLSGVNEETGEPWDFKNIPIGNPNMLMEGPFRDPSGQNIQSTFNFNLETIYEQKFIGDVDPGSAILDIIDNLYAMGTSNMSFYWNEESKIMKEAMDASGGDANSVNKWWDFVKAVMEEVWKGIQSIMTDVKGLLKEGADILNASKDVTVSYGSNDYIKHSGVWYNKGTYKEGNDENNKKYSEVKEQATIDALNSTETKQNQDNSNKPEQTATDKTTESGNIFQSVLKAAQTILTSSIAIFRYELRGSIELMVGGRNSSTPWYLTIGNPYAPWLATNHIIVKSAQVETSTEMSFNDQPQWIKATFNCELSRSLGRQELMRMFNNTYTRRYSNFTQKLSSTSDNSQQSSTNETANANNSQKTT